MAPPRNVQPHDRPGVTLRRRPKQIITQEQKIININKKKFPNIRAKVSSHWVTGTPLRSRFRAQSRRMELLRRTLILNESANKNSQQIPDELAIPPPRGVLHENYYNLWLELSKKENQEVPLPTYSSVVANGSTSMEAFSSPTEVRGERCVT